MEDDVAAYEYDDDIPNYQAGTPLDDLRDDLVADAAFASKRIRRNGVSLIGLRPGTRMHRGVGILAFAGAILLSRAGEPVNGLTQVRIEHRGSRC